MEFDYLILLPQGEGRFHLQVLIFRLNLMTSQKVINAPRVGRPNQ